MKRILLTLLLSFLTAPLLFSQSDKKTAGGEPLSEREILDSELSAASFALMDFATGRILAERNARQPIPPASMTKVMTLFLCYEALDQGVIARDPMVTIDEAGSSFSRPPFSSLMLLEEGQVVSFLDLMKGLAVSSGNDAAYAIAEILGPGRKAFVDKMNAKVRELNLENTVFVDPDGWSKYDRTNARDYARLARAYIENYPEALEELHSVPFLVYPLPENMPDGIDFRIQVPRKKKNTNLLLGRVDGVDGLKTGYVDESGFNFTATAQRDDVRLIAVIMGVHTESYYQGIRRRARESEILLEYGYANYGIQELEAPQFPPQRVWYSADELLTPVAADVPKVLLTDGEASGIYTRIRMKDRHIAPLDEDYSLGEVEYYMGDTLLGRSEIRFQGPVEEGSLIQRIRDRIRLWKEDNFPSS
jgi:D-alanyl-D-alanine carboxypeptidase (penicillin-binding protein 5/6)